MFGGRSLNAGELILLPGLDGTGDLFAPLVRVLPGGVAWRVVTFPGEESLTYPQLMDVVGEALRDARAAVLIAESFSGPLALWYAAANPGRVRAVVLSTTFVRPPAPGWMRLLARATLLRGLMGAGSGGATGMGGGDEPAAGGTRFGDGPRVDAIRAVLLNGARERGLARAVLAATRRVRPEVLALRLREVLRVDARAALRACRAPVLYLRGTRDRLVGAAAGRLVQRVRSDVRVREVAGPHLLLQAAPMAAWREIGAFLADVGIA